MKTLVAEDNFSSRLLLKAILGKHGPCDAAANGSEAVEFLRAAIERREPYDLVCLDIMMPEMDGVQVLRQLRRLESSPDPGEFHPPRPARVIMTSAAGEVQNVLAARSAGCDHFLVKPINSQLLMEHLRTFGLIE